MDKETLLKWIEDSYIHYVTSDILVGYNNCLNDLKNFIGGDAVEAFNEELHQANS